jgi:HEAT repeat protein
MRFPIRPARHVIDVPEWTQWSREVFGDPYFVWHDGADFPELRKRWTHDPGDVTAKIRMGLRSTDPMAARSAAALAAVGGGIELVSDLEARLSSSDGNLRVQIARALAMLTGSSDWTKPIAEILRKHSVWSIRMDAALALADCPATAPGLVALRKAVKRDPEYLVRYHAERTLRAST